MASGDAVQQIKDRLSIIDVVRPYVELHKAGKSYKGKSPFTSEKTPSFFVSPDRGMYYCFSTSQGGDIFSFIQAMEGVDFKGALKLLAEKAGVELVPEDPSKRSERDALYAALEAATVFYQSTLKGESDATTYLEKRGVNQDTIRLWRLGYAPGPPKNGWREASTQLQQANHSESILLKAGLIKATEAGKAPYDVFRDRIMFPVHDPSGRPIAFSGRILSKDSDAPKYVNSPETALFNKSEALYGYDKAKQGIRKFDFSLIVEGQFDVVLAHQAGYTNTVAVSGTAMTEYHAGLLQRLSDRVVLALDADRAGVAAVKRAAEVMLARGMDVKVAELPDGEDPADLIQTDPQNFKALIGKSKHVIEFLLSVLKKQTKDERSFKLKAQEEIVPYVLLLPSHIERDHFESVIAEALGTTKDAVHLEVERKLHERQKPNTDSPAAPESAPTEPVIEVVRAESLLLYLALLSELTEERIYSAVAETLDPILSTPLSTIAGDADSERKNATLFTLEQDFAALKEKEQYQQITDWVSECLTHVLKQKISLEKERLQQAEQAGDDTSTALALIVDLQKQLAAVPTTTAAFSEKIMK